MGMFNTNSLKSSVDALETLYDEVVKPMAARVAEIESSLASGEGFEGGQALPAHAPNGQEQESAGANKGFYYLNDIDELPEDVPRGSIVIVETRETNYYALGAPAAVSGVAKATSININRAAFFAYADSNDIEGTYKLSATDKEPRAATQEEMEETGQAYFDTDWVKVTLVITKVDNDTYTCAATYKTGFGANIESNTETVTVSRSENTDYYELKYYNEKEYVNFIPDTELSLLNITTTEGELFLFDGYSGTDVIDGDIYVYQSTFQNFASIGFKVSELRYLYGMLYEYKIEHPYS